MGTADRPTDFLRTLPDGLPVPSDDGACDHLEGASLPSVALPSTAGGVVDPSRSASWVVLFCYPMTGRPGRPIPEGWAQIPGAAGCTPQACSFRDRHCDLQSLGATVFGLSTQESSDQLEAAERLELPFPLLSDADLQFANALHLPQFEVEGLRLLRRVTLICQTGLIRKFFYPVFPPDRNVDEVVTWLRRYVR